MSRDKNKARLIPGSPRKSAEASENILTESVSPNIDSIKLIDMKKITAGIFFTQYNTAFLTGFNKKKSANNIINSGLKLNINISGINF